MRRVPPTGSPTILLAARWLLYPFSLACVLIATVALYDPKTELGQIATSVAFLGAVALIALMWGRGPAAAAALASAILLNYLSIPPAFAFTVPTSEEAFLLAALLAVALGLGSLTPRMRAVQKEPREWTPSDRLRKTVLNSVSHDLKTPLTAIIGSLGTLLTEARSLEERSQRDLVAIAYEEAQHLDRLVRQVYEMTRVDSGTVLVRRELSSLTDVIEAAVAQLHGTLHDRQCKLEVPRGLPLVPIDHSLFSHALTNILDNAAKYSPPEALIEVGVRREEGWIIVSVADRGMGIPATELDRVFEKVCTGQNSPPPAGSVAGIGFGLLIAKGIVEAHGGQIWAEQRGGGGTVVRVRISLY
jgi:two-component system sensor histidine kinase KdpD